MKSRKKADNGKAVLRQVIFLLSLMMAVAFVMTGCTKDVENEEIKANFNGKEVTGLYTGTIEEGVPNGAGKFIYEHKEDYLEYEGSWKEGTPAGEGTLDTNFFVIDFGDVKRKGSYQGKTLDGIASGEGRFEAVTDDNEKYIYEGSFKNGTFNGQGKRYFPESKESYEEDGNFVNGKFTPTPYEYFKAYGSFDEEEYEISEKSKTFMNEHKNLFVKKKNNTKGLVLKNFSYDKYAKNPEKYGGKLIRVSDLNVVQIFENESWSYKNTTFCILSDLYTEEVYFVRMMKKAEGIYVGDTVTLTALPLDYFTYQSVNDTAIWAIACAGVSIEK